MEPIEMLSFALNKKAYQILMVHNHPSESLVPLESDKLLTHRMIFSGRFLNVPIWDHLIITTHSYYSFLDSGLLEQLEADTTGIPDAVLESILKYEKDRVRKKVKISLFRTQIVLPMFYPKKKPKIEIFGISCTCNDCIVEPD